jgi:hypothetical protein
MTWERAWAIIAALDSALATIFTLAGNQPLSAKYWAAGAFAIGAAIYCRLGGMRS